MAQALTYDFSKVGDRRKAFLARHRALVSERTTWRTHWADISRHLLPRSARFFVTDRNRSSTARYNRIYDNTATRALRTLGAGMQAGTTNPARPWFKLTTQDPDLAEFHPVRMWLDDVVDRMQRVFARSNTYRTLHQMYEELGAFGTAVSVVLPDFENVIHHYPVVCGEYSLQKDYQGRINAMYRELEKTVGETVKEFGIQNVSKAVEHQWNKREHENPVRILHVIEPRADQERDPNSRRPTDMPWKSCHMEIGGDDDKMLRESGYNRFPVLAPRWQVSGDDVYGTSPGMEALGDIRQLQQEQLRKGQGIDYMVRPPLQVPTSIKQRETELFPGGLSYVDPGTMLGHDQSTPNGGIRSAFDVRLDLSHLLADILDVRQRISSSFYEDLFLMLTQPPLHGKTMTATEVAERHEEKLLMIGPVLGRLHNELHHPLIDQTFDHMVDADLLPPPPEELEDQELAVEFVSILDQAQQALGSNATDRFIGNIITVAEGQLATTGSAPVMDNVNFDAWSRDYSEMLGVDPDLMVSEEDVMALRESRARMQAVQEQIAASREQAAAMKDASQVKTDERNVVSDVLNSDVPEEGL